MWVVTFLSSGTGSHIQEDLTPVMAQRPPTETNFPSIIFQHPCRATAIISKRSIDSRTWPYNVDEACARRNSVGMLFRQAGLWAWLQNQEMARRKKQQQKKPNLDQKIDVSLSWCFTYWWLWSWALQGKKFRCCDHSYFMHRFIYPFAIQNHTVQFSWDLEIIVLVL